MLAVQCVWTDGRIGQHSTSARRVQMPNPAAELVVVISMYFGKNCSNFH
jgi:hypothetical protein